MDIQILTDYFIRYGAVFIFIIVLLEYLNLPGFPAGIIMPLAGIWAAGGNISFIGVMFLSIAAGLTGSWILYVLGRYGGGSFMRWISKKPNFRSKVDKYTKLLHEKGSLVVFTAKLIPMVRTIISIPAGAVKMNFISYTISSVLGIFIWNLIFVGIGYFAGDAILIFIS